MPSRYIHTHTGTCIWCKRQVPYVSFNDAPHIVPKSLGGSEIGVDVCDECNHYFGDCCQHKTISPDLAFKEVFNACICSLRDTPLRKKKYSSCLFFYNNKEGKVKLKRSVDLSFFTRKFKRSLYEVFLQKYHSTFPDDNLEKFEYIRQFARYDIGDPMVLFATNKMVLHFVNPEDDIRVNMSDEQKEFINRTGFYHLMFCGKHLFLEVLPITAQTKWPQSLEEMLKAGVIPCDEYCGLSKLTNIWEFDMFFTTLSNKLLYTNGKYLY